MEVHVHRIKMDGPSDMSGLAEHIKTGDIHPEDIVAIIAQTEGDGFARGYALTAFQHFLSAHLDVSTEEVDERIPMLMIGLTGGLMSPHATVFTRHKGAEPAGSEKRLALGIQVTRPLRAEEIGRLAQVELVADAVRRAVREAGLESPADVHCVEVKCPNITEAHVADAGRRGVTVASLNPVQGGNLSKGASALGVAVGLGEIDADAVRDESICSDWSLYSKVASTSSGNEQRACKVLVFGNSAESSSPFRVGSGIMEDQLDLDGLREAFVTAGLRFADGVLRESERSRVVNVFVNAGGNAQGSCRGRRHTMHSDFLSGYSGIFAKAVCNAVVGALIGDSMIMCSAGWEHQGKPGSNLVATFVRVED